ncbi:hypothetical protein GAY28_10125 [Azospirillum brasilense]|nr:hypothetical protein [Azospirillum brasilense]
MARPKTITKQKLVGLTDELAQRIDDFRFTNRFREETAAIRRLIEIGLQGYEADIRYSGILERETAEEAELEAHGSGHIFHAGVSAGINASPLDRNPYASPAARELWLKGYIRGTEQRLGGRPTTEES